ncbi:MAG: hypothetical protein K2X93_18670 [Candidatus Obscuribacterales bacterium]|nr:hypothetical protein [Candidatus Obscuribacterales bacterium]
MVRRPEQARKGHQVVSRSRLVARLAWCLSIPLLASCGGGGPNSTPFTKSAFTATYEQIRTPGKGATKNSFRMSSDGVGRKCYVDDTRFLPAGNYRRIDDHNLGKEYWLDAKEKQATYTLLKNTNNWNLDEAWLKADGWLGKLTPTGEKNINGRNCRGYNFQLRSSQPTVIEYWFDQGSGCVVSANCKVKGVSSWSVKMTSFSPQALPHSNFEIPDDWDIFEDTIGSDKEDASNPFDDDRSEPPL